MHLPRHLLLLCLVALAVATALGTAHAQVGARAMGMGGAFVGLADDAEAVYYNPAGMAFQPCASATMSFAANNQDEPTFDDFLNGRTSVRDFVGFTTPFDPQSAIGFGFLHSMVASLDFYDYDNGDFNSVDWNENQYWLAGAYRWDKLALGANFRWTTDHVSLDWRGEGPSVNADTPFSFDLGLLYCISSQARLGVMVRDVNEPEQSFNFEDLCLHRTLPRTYSVGLAFHNLGGYSPGLTGVIQAEDISDATDRAFRVAWSSSSNGAAMSMPCAPATSAMTAPPRSAPASPTRPGPRTSPS